MKLSFLVSILCALLLLWGCKYEPTGSNFVEVDSNDYGTDVPVLTLSQLGDTLAIPRTVAIDFDFTTDRRIYSIEVLIDDEVINNSSSDRDVLIIPELYSTGYHSLKINAIVSSNTGSLADVTNQEAIQFSFEKVFEVDNDPPNQIPVNSIEIVDGRLSVTWPTYKRINFERYLLFRSIGFQSFEFIEEYSNPNETSFIDSEILDGKVSYKIAVDAVTGFVEGPEKEFEVEDFNIMSSFNTPERTVDLSWNYPLLYNNFKSYQIRKGRTGNWTSVWSSSDINDTTVTVDLSFGGVNTFEFTSNTSTRIGAGEILELILGEQVAGLGNSSFSRINQIEYNAADDIYYINNSGSLYSLDLNTNSVLNTFDGVINYLELRDGTLYAEVELSQYPESYIATLDPQTLEILEEYYPSQITDIDDIIHNLSIGEGGIVAFNSGYYESPTLYVQEKILYNLESDQLLGTFEALETLIPHNSGFVTVGTTLFEASETTLSPFENFSSAPQQVYMPNDNTLLVFLLSNETLTIETWNYSTKTKISDFQLNETVRGLLKINQINGTFAITTNSQLKVYKLEDFSLINTENLIGRRIHFLNNHIFSSEGYFLELKE